jgi:hypothetical protein
MSISRRRLLRSLGYASVTAPLLTATARDTGDDIIIRGGNPLVTDGGRNSGRGGGPRIDHISFGIAPWDTDVVKAQLVKRGLKVTIDTSSRHLEPPQGSRRHLGALRNPHGGVQELPHRHAERLQPADQLRDEGEPVGAGERRQPEEGVGPALTSRG